MNITKNDFANYVNSFRIKELFIDMGWDNERTAPLPINLGEIQMTANVLANKSGFKIIECMSKEIPTYPFRMKAAQILKKLYHEHIIIFHDDRKFEQVWLYCYRFGGQFRKSELRYNIEQSIERLYQRASGLIFELDEQDTNTIIDVVARVRSNFAANAETVTKRFYEAFKRQHTMFLNFIEGIEAEVDKEWYASIMLNRLMFCYFMQRRGFLNRDRNYLRTKFNESKERLGTGKFYSFYRSFLMKLFHQGFGDDAHTPEIREMIGEIPYLNGGIFDLHELEKIYQNIDISDEAFGNIFDLFDQYEWHLDTRDCATGNEINPDVLGYIFEKYINDRNAMGAYYTKEDITGYISRSTILPWLLENTKKIYPQVFEPDGAVWTFLKESGDEYIFSSVKRGVDLPLPDYIEIGVDTSAPELIKRRIRWNEPANSDYALPTEIWREVVERRERYNKAYSLIVSGGITETSDLITYNLDIVNFITDLIETIEDPKFIWAFYSGLEQMTILDPTCGSGAFLFAALNILEPLYDRCLSRMEDYLNHDYKGIMDRSIRRFFDERLEIMESGHRPSKEYFIYKSIILNNLYGVDIMREAVETAKLRLFLKLVSTVEPDYNIDNIGIEPLPDIDFNIKSGNALIGYANVDEVKEALSHDMFAAQMAGETNDAMFRLAKATSRFKQLQLGMGDSDAGGFRQAKAELTGRQNKLKETLDDLLRKWDYDDVSDENWEANYTPFHWISEFYSIIEERGGFDVIIGNPPYVEYSSARRLYKLNNFVTLSSSNLYAYVIERSIDILSSSSYYGMIIPQSAYCTDRMDSLQNLQFKTSDMIWLSFYAERPSKLFEGAERSLAISIVKKTIKYKDLKALFSTYYNKWNAEYREHLFTSIYYQDVLGIQTKGVVPKISCFVEKNIMKKIRKNNHVLGDFTSRAITSNILYYRNSGGRYWKAITTFQPKFIINGELGKSSRESYLYFEDEIMMQIASAVLNSTLYYWSYIMSSDARTNNPSDLKNFIIDLDNIDNTVSQDLINAYTSLMENLLSNAVMQSARYRTGDVEFQKINPKLSKPIIDQIDTILAQHYGFTEEELDYIINYDIKYRMGIGGASDGNSE